MPAGAVESGPFGHAGGLNPSLHRGPVLRQAGIAAFDPAARSLRQRATKDREEIMEWPQGVKRTPPYALEHIEDVGRSHEGEPLP